MTRAFGPERIAGLPLFWRGTAYYLHQVAGAQLAREGCLYIRRGKFVVTFRGAGGFVERQTDFGAA